MTSVRLLAVLALLPLAACGDADTPAEAPEAPTVRAESGVLDHESLLARFPETVSTLPQAAASGETDGALGYEVTRATVTYTRNIDVPGPTVVVNVLDLGSAEMVRNAGYGWALDASAADTTFAGYPAEMPPRTRGGRTSVTVVVGDRFVIESKGEAMPQDATEEAVRALGLPALDSLAAVR